MKDQLIKLKTGEDSFIALWKITSNESLDDKNILLAHGTFSNRKVLNGIAEYLAKNKFTCWIFEWRNHGHSSPTKENFNFEAIAKKEVLLAFDYLFEELQIKQIDCVTHSGGGICLTMALVNEPQYKSKIRSISMFGCQAFGAATSTYNYVKLWAAKFASKLVGSIPATKIGGEENESYYYMKQWLDWNIKRNFIGEEGFDYRDKMPMIKIPILSICGAGDHFIAPPEGCKSFLAAYKNESNKLIYCSKETGYSENYNHSRLLHSRNAAKEIYPQVLKWINDSEYS